MPASGFRGNNDLDVGQDSLRGRRIESNLVYRFLVVDGQMVAPLAFLYDAGELQFIVHVTTLTLK